MRYIYSFNFVNNQQYICCLFVKLIHLDVSLIFTPDHFGPRSFHSQVILLPVFSLSVFMFAVKICFCSELPIPKLEKQREFENRNIGSYRRTKLYL